MKFNTRLFDRLSFDAPFTFFLNCRKPVFRLCKIMQLPISTAPCDASENGPSGSPPKKWYEAKLISVGITPTGYIAIGIVPMGVVSIGVVPMGVVSLGLVSMGAIAAGFVSMGIAAFGGVSMSTLNGHQGGHRPQMVQPAQNNPTSPPGSMSGHEHHH